MFNDILVVCAGNICRSPMGEGLLKAHLPHKKVHSAGLIAMVNHPADPLAIACMDEIGVDISAHRARQITQAMVKQADLVLVMSTEQVRSIEQQWPFAKGKTFRIGHWNNASVPDPYRHPKEAFEHARALLVDGVSAWLKRIG